MRAQRASTPHTLPDRVLVYGVTGSGKSTAATRIGAITGHPVTLVDELTWLPGWVPVEEERQREIIGGILAGERWLLDSAYGAWRKVVARDSIIRWHFQSFARKRLRMREWAASPDGPEVLLFRRPRELDAWIESFRRS
ncbi:hypothetical protein L2K70_19615 [Nocardioides KLBMP 9356]|uniref:Adenylate kinase n=1 Tax=Nocardioides potassii TaxID=2911371 RepID=A0ABS9HHE9_9ACTN|nr:hypothetical protein [Nocardioides potassii]MCF6379827.1 hypothetical protein [Nocardioides potassii]